MYNLFSIFVRNCYQIINESCIFLRTIKLNIALHNSLATITETVLESSWLGIRNFAKRLIRL